MIPRKELGRARFSVPLGLGMEALGSSEGGTYTLGTELFNKSIRGLSVGEIAPQCQSEGHLLFLVSEWDLWRKADDSSSSTQESALSSRPLPFFVIPWGRKILPFGFLA